MGAGAGICCGAVRGFAGCDGAVRDVVDCRYLLYLECREGLCKQTVVEVETWLVDGIERGREGPEGFEQGVSIDSVGPETFEVDIVSGF